MSLLGKAALAMWWDMAPERLAEFEHWHTHEHFPERLRIPGFLRASRWTCAQGGEGVFVMYELQDHGVLSSPPYLARLNAPTPWSTRMMPHHRHMVRSQCRVLESRGAGVARRLLTIRLSPQEGRGEELRSAIGSRIGELAGRPGLAGAHLLRHETPPVAVTEEQRIRGLSDRFADWVLLVCAYDDAVLRALAREELGPGRLEAVGAAPDAQSGLYALSCTGTPGDMA